MSIFGKIKDAIFGHKSAQQQQPNANAQAQAQPHGGGQAQSQTQTTTVPQPAQNVDVGQVLDNIAASKGNPDLNYKTSIVDLMKVLGLDSSLDNRKELATELGYTGPKDGSAEMNIWLQKAVMRQLAANGGKVPASMMD